MNLGYSLGVSRPAKTVGPAVDSTPPTVVSMTVESDGTTLTVVFDEEMNPFVVGTGFGLNVNESFAITPANGIVSGNTITYTIDLVHVGDSIEGVYDDGDVTDVALNALATFNGFAVTNNSNQ